MLIGARTACSRLAWRGGRRRARPARRLSVSVLVNQIRDYIDHWNTDSKPFVWTTTADDILTKVQFTQTSIRKPVGNNAK
jgi:hypothetical protein